MVSADGQNDVGDGNALRVALVFDDERFGYNTRDFWVILRAFVGEPPYELMGFQPGDGKIMQVPLDWIGINYYSRRIVSDSGSGQGFSQKYSHFGMADGSDGPTTYRGWEVWPRGLYDIVTRIAREYAQPIEITENGCSYSDGAEPDGSVPDSRRIAYYKSHLAELARAIRDGARVRGYHAWSLLDNFEWGDGYSQRFGMVWVDFRDQRRIIQDSGHWYGRVAASNRLDV